MDSTSRSVAVTGALGNLGWKLLNHLAAHSTCSRLVGLDVKEADQAQRDELRKAAKGREVEIEFVPCDLTDWRDRRWRDAFDRVDVSVAMNYNTAHAATDSKSVNRYVFATSNHVMGRYKDRPLGPGELRPELEPGVGTLWHTGEKDMDSTVYATAKWAGERLCQALGQRAGGETSFACVRIGWCQPGENNPRTLSAAGTPTQAGSGGEESETDAWYKGMWLSNGDFCQLFQRSIEADASAWPGGCIVVNGMSNNTGMKWNLEAARQYLNYEPRDDVYAS